MRTESCYYIGPVLTSDINRSGTLPSKGWLVFCQLRLLNWPILYLCKAPLSLSVNTLVLYWFEQKTPEKTFLSLRLRDLCVTMQPSTKGLPLCLFWVNIRSCVAMFSGILYSSFVPWSRLMQFWLPSKLLLWLSKSRNASSNKISGSLPDSLGANSLVSL